jgi:hypothetical protein
MSLWLAFGLCPSEKRYWIHDFYELVLSMYAMVIKNNSCLLSFDNLYFSVLFLIVHWDWNNKRYWKLQYLFLCPYALPVAVSIWVSSSLLEITILSLVPAVVPAAITNWVRSSLPVVWRCSAGWYPCVQVMHRVPLCFFPPTDLLKCKQNFVFV